LRASKSRHKDQLIEGTSLKRIIERSLSVIGTPAMCALLHDLETAGIYLEQGKAYSLNEVRRVLVSLFGADATDIMMDRIYREFGARSAP
jgi:hypothetical protein